MIGTIMARLGREPVSFETIEDAIFSTMQTERWHGKPEPEFEAMLRRGLVHECSVDAEGILHECPIPSLRSFAVIQTGPPLHRITLSGKAELIDDHLTATQETEVRDAWGRTPLHIAAQENWPVVLVSLLDHGAELEATDQWGQTAMHIAAQENAKESLAALIAAGATHQAVDMKGETPLHHAAREDSARAVEMLIQAGVNPNVLSRTGKMPLDLAPPNGASRHILAMVTCHPDTREPVS